MDLDVQTGFAELKKKHETNEQIKPRVVASSVYFCAFRSYPNPPLHRSIFSPLFPSSCPSWSHKRDASVRIHLTSVTVLQCLFCADTGAATDVLAPQVLACRRRGDAEVRGIFSNTLFIWRPFPVCGVYIRSHGRRRRRCTASANIALGRCRNRCAVQPIDRSRAWRIYKCRGQANATPDGDFRAHIALHWQQLPSSKVAIKVKRNRWRNGRGTDGAGAATLRIKGATAGSCSDILLRLPTAINKNRYVWSIRALNVSGDGPCGQWHTAQFASLETRVGQ